MSALRSMPNPIPVSFYVNRAKASFRKMPAPQRDAMLAKMDEKMHLVEMAAQAAADEDHALIVAALEEVLRDNGIPV